MEKQIPSVGKTTLENDFPNVRFSYFWERKRLPQFVRFSSFLSVKSGTWLAALLLTSLVTRAQQQRFGNEWIQPNQRYLKIAVTQAGRYRLGYETLKAADPAFVQTAPARWQLFFRGREVAVRVVGQADGTFDAADFLEFVGRGNDGAQDSLLYRPQKRLHPYQSLFSDTAAYFLTVHPTQAGRRMAESNRPAAGLTPEPFHAEETVQAFTSEYTFNNLRGIEPALQQSFYEPGEGWSGRLLTADSVGTVRFALTGRLPGPIAVEGMVNGRDNSSHELRVQAGNAASPLATLQFPGFLSQTFRQPVDPTALQAETLTLRFNFDKNPRAGRHSITYAKLSYPQATDMAGAATKRFRLPPNAAGVALLAVQNAPADAAAYDLTDPLDPRFLTVERRSTEARLVVGDATQTREILVTSQALQPLYVRPVRFQAPLSPATTYLFVTHAGLRVSAEAYARYRASGEGGGHRTAVVEADSLYDAFNYGEKSPLALRRFFDFALATTAAKNLLLVGRARSYPYDVKTTPDDRVPTVGYPGSDLLLTAGLRGLPPNTPALPTGRIPAATNQQVLGYLAKVKQFEGAMPNGLWRKHLVHISGGKSPEEARGLRRVMERLGDSFAGGTLGGRVSAFGKTTTAEVETINLAPLVNEGVSLITFFGHAGPEVTDVNFGFASPPQNGYRNQFLPLMVFNGCGVGEIFSKFNTLSTDWLLAPQRGAVAVMAHSYWSFEESTTRYLTRLYGSLFTDPATLGQSIGAVQQGLNRVADAANPTPHDVSVLLQMVLQGDPALSLYPLPEPDFAVESNRLFLRSNAAGKALKNGDSLRVVVPLANLGRFVPGQVVSGTLKKTTAVGSVVQPFRFDAFRFRDTLVLSLAKDPALWEIVVTLDPDNRVAELTKTNNVATLAVDWAAAQDLGVYPASALPDRVPPTLGVWLDGAVPENGTTTGLSPTLDVYLLDDSPLAPGDTSAVEVFLKTCPTCASQKLPLGTTARSYAVTAVAPNQLRASLSLPLAAGTAYQLLVLGKDAAGNRTQPPFVLDLRTLAADEPVALRAYPNPATTFATFDLTVNRRELPSDARLSVYSPTGQRLFDEKKTVKTGKNAWLWPVPGAGLFLGAVTLTWPDGRTETLRAKIVAQP